MQWCMNKYINIMLNACFIKKNHHLAAENECEILMLKSKSMLIAKNQHY